MVESRHSKLEEKFPNVGCDAFVITPNRIHIIVTLDESKNLPGKTALSKIVQRFKTMTTNEYIRGVKTKGWSRFEGRLWQCNYWEHVVRNERDVSEIYQYIQDNSAKWELDKLNKNSPWDNPILLR